MYNNEEYENPETFPRLLLSLHLFISQSSEIDSIMNNALEAP